MTDAEREKIYRAIGWLAEPDELRATYAITDKGIVHTLTWPDGRTSGPRP